ncbi:MAG: insulinase family protein [Verrucomicrobia bacterium]|nr:MAG: insulinase family protein [Verrucomicrobiota bacterium]
MRLLVLTGSLDERPDELGIAHFTEHMCFRGTTNLRYEDMVSFFQRLGMEYGSDVNAVTTFDYTAYSLDFREHDPELLDEGLRLFREFAHEVTFAPEAIEKERNVILAEMRSRDSISDRLSFASLGAIFKGLEIANRVPIGTEQSIRSVTREHFLNFYRRGYRPDLMVLVAAGDFDADAFAAAIRRRFGDIPRPTVPVPARNTGRLDTARSLRAEIFTVSDIGSAQTTVASTQPAPRDGDSLERHIERARRRFAMQLLSRRLQTNIPDAGDGSATYQSILGHEAAMASVRVRGDDWQHGLLAVEQVIRSTWQRGFTRSEIESARRPMLKYARHMLELAATTDPHSLVDDLVESITTHAVYLGLERELQLTIDWLETITPRDLLQSFRAAWDLDRVVYHIAGDVDIEDGPEEVVRVMEKQRRGRSRYVQVRTRKEAQFTAKRWGRPTEVVESTVYPELGLETLRFANNVRLNLIESPSEPGIVYSTVRVGTGLLDMPGDQPALKEFGLQVLLASGTTHLNTEQLGRVLEDHMLEFSFDVADHDAFTFRGTTVTEDLETFLAVVTDFLYKPLFITGALRSEKLRATISRSSSLGLGEGMRALTNHLFEGDARFAWGTFNNYLGLSVSDVRNWLQRPLSRGYVEISIVGDVDRETAVDLVSRTLGSLEKRDPAKTFDLPPAPPKVAAPPGFKRIEFVGEQHLGLVVGTWPIESPLTVRDKAALHVLTKILELRIREEVRDNRGLAYSPSVEFTPYNGFPRFALMQAMIDCDPLQADAIAPIVADIAASVAREGVRESEFIGSRGILASQVRRGFLDNMFLLSLVQRAQERPESIQEAIQLKNGLIDDVTIDEVNTWARRILGPENTRTAAIVPKPFIGIFQTSER